MEVRGRGMNEPTPEDLSRDLAAELALCGEATPGPWVYPVPGATSAEAIGAALPAAPGHPRRRGTRVVATSRLAFKSSRQCEADAVFIAAAREGWPAALRRALAAEAEVARLRATLAEIADLPPAREDEGCGIACRALARLERAP
jgi:hypothetical protein